MHSVLGAGLDLGVALKPGHRHGEGARDLAVQAAGAADDAVHVPQGFSKEGREGTICRVQSKDKKPTA